MNKEQQAHLILEALRSTKARTSNVANEGTITTMETIWSDAEIEELKTKLKQLLN